MSTRLNSLLCFMLLVLSATVLGPLALHHHEHVVATAKSIGEDMTAFSRQLFGMEAATDETASADLGAHMGHEFTKVVQAFDGVPAMVEKAMTDDARDISHMLNAKVELVRLRAADGMATDKKTVEKNVAWLSDTFPTVASDARTMLRRSTDIAALLHAFDTQPGAVAAVRTNSDVADNVEAAPAPAVVKPVKLAAIHKPKLAPAVLTPPPGIALPAADNGAALDKLQVRMESGADVHTASAE